MKSFTLFGICIPITREKQERPPLIGAAVKVRGKNPVEGIITNVRWCGLCYTITSHDKSKKNNIHAAKPTLPTRNSPKFVNVWRWRVELLKK